MSKILSIDPGYDRCGVALITVVNGSPTLDHSFCITTKKSDEHSIRLATIFTELQKAITELSPDHIALETLFFSVNKKTALKVAEARGVIVALAGLYSVPLVELSPQEVKLAMTGVGNANKEQVQKMVQLSLKINLSDRLDDEIDAIAVGFAAAGALRLSQFK